MRKKEAPWRQRKRKRDQRRLSHIKCTSRLGGDPSLGVRYGRREREEHRERSEGRGGRRNNRKGCLLKDPFEST